MNNVHYKGTRFCCQGRIPVLSGLASVVTGFALLLIRTRLEYIDEEGILHESFCLVPAAFLLIAAGTALLIFSLLRTLVRE